MGRIDSDRVLHEIVGSGAARYRLLLCHMDEEPRQPPTETAAENKETAAAQLLEEQCGAPRLGVQRMEEFDEILLCDYI
jgi:hypothetical protein